MKHLDFCENPLGHFPEFLLMLSELQYLEANQCRIKSLPEEIQRLHCLETFYMTDNQLQDLPESFRELRKMRLCYLDNNPFQTDIADKKPQSKNLVVFRYQKPIEPAPREELPQSGRMSETPPPTPVETLHNHIMNEARVIVLGLPGAGKTTLCRKILDANAPFEHPGSTEGIDIHRWQFETTPDGVQLTTNIWDFGGQEKYESYHPFFMTNQHTVYVVVANGVEENKANLEKWLEIVNRKAPESPVTVVISKADERRWENLDEGQLRQKCPKIGDILRISSKTGENIEKLRKNIKEAVKNLPGFAQESTLPKGWQNVRKQIEKLSLPDASGNRHTHINISDFEALCKQEGITDTIHIKELAGYLHNIGSILYYPNNLRLNHLMVLNMKWAVNGVYKVLDSPIVTQNKGRFNQRNAVEVWKASDKGESFPIATHGYLIELLKNFEFCYELQQGEYIVPDRMPVSRPATLPEPHGNLLQAQLEYRTSKFPQGLLTRLMVRLGEKISWEHSWQQGIVLTYGDSMAILENLSANLIRLTIGASEGNAGKDRFALFQLLKNELHFICEEKDISANQLQWKIACYCTVDEKCFFEENFLFGKHKKSKTIDCTKNADEEHSAGQILATAYAHFEDGWELTAQKLKKDRAKSLFDKLKTKHPDYNADKHLQQFNLFTLKKETGYAARIRQRMINICTCSNSEEALREMVRDLSIDLEMFSRKKWNVDERVTLGGIIGSNSDLMKSYPEFAQDLADALHYRNEEVHTKELPQYESEQLIPIINTYFRVYLLLFHFDPKSAPAKPPTPAPSDANHTSIRTNDEIYEGQVTGFAPGRIAILIKSDVFKGQTIAWEGKQDNITVGSRVKFKVRKESDGSMTSKPFQLPNGTVVHNYIADEVIISR